MSKEHDRKVQCAMQLNEMIQLMKGKVGYDEDDMIFLIQHWAKVGDTFPNLARPAIHGGKNYGAFIKKYFVAGKITAASEVAANPPDEPESKEKSSQYLYKRLLDLANNIYVDTGWGYLAFNQTEGAILRLVWNYRVMLARSDADLAKKFQARLLKLHL